MAASPRPISSGCSWAARARLFRVVRFFTREGVRGRSGRFFFLAAMQAPFDADGASPSAELDLDRALGHRLAGARRAHRLLVTRTDHQSRTAPPTESGIPQRLPSIVATAPTPRASAPAAATTTGKSSGGRRIRRADHPEVRRRLVREQLDVEAGADR